jgi:hypothetical protein
VGAPRDPNRLPARQCCPDSRLVEGSDILRWSACLHVVSAAPCQRDFDRDFKKKVRHLIQAVEGVGNGTWTIPGAEPASVRRIVPVLASLHPFPLFGPMWTPFTAAFATPTFGHGTVVTPLQLVTDEDLEILEAFQAAGSMSIVDTLTRRASNQAWTESRMLHVILRAWRLMEPSNAGMQTLYRTAATAISNAVVGAFDLG